MSRLLHSPVLRSFRHFILALMLLAIAGLFITSHTHGDGSGAVSNTPAPASYFDPSHYTPEQLSFSTINDGIPDVWKEYYGFSVSDPELVLADYNGTGTSNLVKYLANLWPLDAPEPQPQPPVPEAPVIKASSTQPKAAATPAPAFSFKGAFSNNIKATDWKSGTGGYEGGAFKWFQVNGSVGNWVAYEGKKIEVWTVYDKDKKKDITFVELDATGKPDYGIKQELKNITPGTYLLTWEELGRRSGPVDGNEYEVQLGYGNTSSKAPIQNKTILKRLPSDKKIATNGWVS